MNYDKGRKEVLTMPELIAEIPKNKGEKLCVRLTEYNGLQLVDMRCYSLLDDAPTRKGLTIRPELLPALISALQRAQQALEQ